MLGTVTSVGRDRKVTRREALPRRGLGGEAHRVPLKRSIYVLGLRVWACVGMSSLNP